MQERVSERLKRHQHLQPVVHRSGREHGEPERAVGHQPVAHTGVEPHAGNVPCRGGKDLLKAQFLKPGDLALRVVGLGHRNTGIREQGQRIDPGLIQRRPHDADALVRHPHRAEQFDFHACLPSRIMRGVAVKVKSLARDDIQ